MQTGQEDIQLGAAEQLLRQGCLQQQADIITRYCNQIPWLSAVSALASCALNRHMWMQASRAGAPVWRGGFRPCCKNGMHNAEWDAAIGAGMSLCLQT